MIQVKNFLEEIHYCSDGNIKSDLDTVINNWLNKDENKNFELIDIKYSIAIYQSQQCNGALITYRIRKKDD